MYSPSMAREGTIIALPPFYGVTRRLAFTVLACFVAALVLHFAAPAAADTLLDHSMLMPARALHGELWQFLTYPFVNLGLLSVLFAALSLWFVGSLLESEKGSRWLVEYFLVCTLGGGLLAALLSRFLLAGSADFGPHQRASGIWPAILAMLLAYARMYPDAQARMYFFIPIRMKFLVAIYLVIYLAATITGGARFDAMTALLVCLSGFLYLRFAPRRGLRFSASEGWYGLRNAWYRRKRRQAAKKFTVYMRKQGKDVNLDSSGRYVSLDEERRDPDDKRWMN